MPAGLESGRLFDTLTRLPIPPAFPTDSGGCNNRDNNWSRVTCILQHRSWPVYACWTTHIAVRIHVEGAVSLARHLHIAIVRLLDNKVIVQTTLLQTLRKLITQTRFPGSVFSTHELVIWRLSQLVSILIFPRMLEPLFSISRLLLPHRLQQHYRQPCTSGFLQRPGFHEQCLTGHSKIIHNLF